jgi:hypothetical protein
MRVAGIGLRTDVGKEGMRDTRFKVMYTSRSLIAEALTQIPIMGRSIPRTLSAR